MRMLAFCTALLVVAALLGCDGVSDSVQADSKKARAPDTEIHGRIVFDETSGLNLSVLEGAGANIHILETGDSQDMLMLMGGGNGDNFQVTIVIYMPIEPSENGLVVNHEYEIGDLESESVPGAFNHFNISFTESGAFYYAIDGGGTLEYSAGVLHNTFAVTMTTDSPPDGGEAETRIVSGAFEADEVSVSCNIRQSSITDTELGGTSDTDGWIGVDPKDYPFCQQYIR